MELSKCRLFGIQSKRTLSEVLKIPDKSFLKQSKIINLIYPYIDVLPNGKKRLIEVPDDELKKIQTNIKICFYDLSFPYYVFSGVRKRSYIDNAYIHTGINSLYKLDFSAFFPNIDRNKVYKFFRQQLQMSSDVANIITNFTTIDMTKIPENEDVENFLLEKNIMCKNHLISGSPASQVLSYLVNIEMFNELYQFSQLNNLTMTVYVDDIFFSSCYKISNAMIRKIKAIISRSGYKISENKEKYYTKTYPKEVTGVIIDSNGKLKIKNLLGKNIIEEIQFLKEVKSPTLDNKKRLQGLVTTARQIEKNKFNALNQFAFDK